MAGGWTRDGAVQEQIDDSVTDAVLRARSLMPHGENRRGLRRVRRADPQETPRRARRRPHLRRLPVRTWTRWSAFGDQPPRLEG